MFAIGLYRVKIVVIILKEDSTSYKGSRLWKFGGDFSITLKPGGDETS